MSQRRNLSDLPLSAAALRSITLEVPRHDAEVPKAAALEPLKFALQVVDHRSLQAMGDPPDVLPSMPSYAEMSATPAPLPVSPPPRVVFAGFELEPFVVFPPDGRAPYTDCRFPWVCLCRVASGTRGGCGVLVGPRHVLTASHVIDWQALTVSVSFVQSGITLASAGATHIMAYEHIVDVTYTNADDDYAVLMLASRLGETFGALGVRTYDSDWDNETASWWNISYAPDVAGGTWAASQTGFFLDEDDFDLGGGRMLITKTGDFVRGMSGSPVFGFWNEGPFVVGVTSGGVGGLGNFNAIAGGSNLTRLINKARADFP